MLAFNEVNDNCQDNANQDHRGQGKIKTDVFSLDKNITGQPTQAQAAKKQKKHPHKGYQPASNYQQFTK